MNRILLVDLGERELKKRQELRGGGSPRRAETPASDCTDGLEVKP